MSLSGLKKQFNKTSQVCNMIFQKQSLRGVFINSCSKKFLKFTGKLLTESVLSEVTCANLAAPLKKGTISVTYFPVHLQCAFTFTFNCA